MWKRLFWVLGPRYRGPDPVRPVFIVGCGRSGTTILGRIMSQHRRLLYVHEARYIWARQYPQTDIWSSKAAIRGGRLELDGGICTPEKNRATRRMFGLALCIYGKDRLVEKLPVHSFRVPFLLSIFPDALFIHVIRHGMEVARSIDVQAAKGQWYGWNDYKWEQLRSLTTRFPWGEEALGRCTDALRRGLLEWRLSLEIGTRHLDDLPEGRSLSVRYEALLADPLGVCGKIRDFLGEDPDEDMDRFSAQEVSRRSSRVDATTQPPDMSLIAGDWLERLGYA